MVPLTGIEPMAYSLGESRSIRLSYRGRPAVADTHYPNLFAAVERNSPAATMQSGGGTATG